MQRIRRDNINTEEYWNNIYTEARLTVESNGSVGDVAWEIVKHIEFRDSVLDIGVGTGKVLKKILGIRPNLGKVGICDISANALDFLRKEFPYLSSYQYDLNTEEIPDINHFDVVYSTEVIEHLENPEGLVKQMVRLANKKVIISCPYKRYIEDKEHIWEFDLDDMYELLKPYGYVNLSVCNGGSNILAVCNLNHLNR